MKTNTDLVSYAKKALAEKWVYWYGTTGVRCTGDLLSRKTAQYPKEYTSSRMPTYQQHIKDGRMCADCINLAKGFIWLDESTGKQVYASNGCPDKSADGIFSLAVIKGPISTLPEIPGVMVRFSGHAGIYIGNGKVIEARGFSFGIVQTNLSERPWTDWYKMPGITYPVANREPKQYVERGDKGPDVIALQKMLIRDGYDVGRWGADGDFGAATEQALKLWLFDRYYQHKARLPIDQITR